jgi:glutaredoxin-related protein
MSKVKNNLLTLINKLINKKQIPFVQKNSTNKKAPNNEDFRNSIKTQNINTSNKISLHQILPEILAKSKAKKNLKVSLENYNIHINLESKIPFVLIMPLHLKNNQTLAMESNNAQTNNKSVLLRQALETGKMLNDALNGTSPILVPILPDDPEKLLYYQQLSSECFECGERPDLDVVNTINIARKIIAKQYNVKINNKIFLHGYSSSGCFAQRFCLIHPELVDTACIGGAYGSIPIPNSDFDYPIGIKNYSNLFDTNFNMNEYKKIAFDYYVGSLECKKKAQDRMDDNYNPVPMHDMSYFDKSVPTNVGKEQRSFLGKNMFFRSKNTIETLKKMGIDIENVIIPNATHNNKEAIDLMNSNPKYQDVKSATSFSDMLIKSSFQGMLKRQKSKGDTGLEL